MTEKKIPVTKYETIYIAKDGKEFSSKSACEDYEEILNGTRKVCSRCGGKGQINITKHVLCGADAVGYTEEQNTYYSGDRCPDCNGKGYFRKVTEWQPCR